MDLDLSKEIFYEVMVEYEGLQDFCTPCKSISHNVTSYQWLHPRKAYKNEKPVDKGKKPMNSKDRSKGGSHMIIVKVLVPLRLLKLQHPNRKMTPT